MMCLLQSVRIALICAFLLISFPAMTACELDLPAFSTTYDAKRDPYADTQAALKLARRESDD